MSLAEHVTELLAATGVDIAALIGRDQSLIDQVMAAQSDLVEIMHTLRQVVCVKG